MAESKRIQRKEKTQKTDADLIELGNRRELFVDEYLIERMENVQLRLHKPVPRNVAIEHDAPWEGNTSGYHTIFKDGQLFRAYYRGSHYEANAPYNPVVCYAETVSYTHLTLPTNREV